MIRFIDEHRDRFGVEASCRTLRATTSGFITSRAYRAAKTRPASARALRDEVLLPEIKRIHQENYSVYGVRKMHHAMLRSGWQIGRDQLARLMRIAGLQSVRRGRKPRTTRPAGHPDTRLDLVERRFTAERPNQLWVADITYVRVLTGLCYVAFITYEIVDPEPTAPSRWGSLISAINSPSNSRTNNSSPNSSRKKHNDQARPAGFHHMDQHAPTVSMAHPSQRSHSLDSVVQCTVVGSDMHARRCGKTTGCALLVRRS